MFRELFRKFFPVLQSFCNEKFFNKTPFGEKMSARKTENCATFNRIFKPRVVFIIGTVAEKERFCLPNTVFGNDATFGCFGPITFIPKSLTLSECSESDGSGSVLGLQQAGATLIGHGAVPRIGPEDLHEEYL